MFPIPLRDENPTRTFPIVVVLLIGVNIAVYVYQSLLSDVDLFLFRYTYSVIPVVVTGQAKMMEAIGAAYPQAYGYLTQHGLQPHALAPVWLTIFSSMFLHGNLVHLGGNMLYLWIFGNNVEDIVGHVRFLIFYLVCGVIAAMAQIALTLHSPAPMLGASGAVAGVLGAYYLRFPTARVLTLLWILYFVQLVYLPASLLLFLWFLLQVIQSVTSLGGSGGGGVAVFAHVGGFVAGWLLVRVFARGGGRPRGIRWERG